MKLKCENCDKELNIPDSKVPAGKSFSIKCPSCGQKISGKKEENAPEQAPVESTPESPKAAIDFEVKKREPVEDFLDDFGPGELTALVCDKENTADIERALEEMNYRMSLATDASTAVNKIKFNTYNLIIINENYDGFSLKENPVIKYLNPMPMRERRYIFVVLIGDNFKTTDNMTAFSLSVNLVVNTKDINKLANILKRGIQENEQFYKIFKESLTAAGKV